MFALASLMALTSAFAQEQPFVSDVAEPAVTDFDVEVIVDSSLSSSKIYKYTIGADEFVLTVRNVYLVMGNLSLLEPGEAPPGYKRNSGVMDPLQLASHAVDGYRVIDLLASNSLGVIRMPMGFVGPLYMAASNADASTEPLADAVPEIADAMLVVKARLVVGTLLDKELVFKTKGERLFVLAAPAFWLEKPVTLRLTVDTDAWFAGVDFSKLSHSTNIIQINESSNIDAFALVAERAEQALRGATLSIE